MQRKWNAFLEAERGRFILFLPVFMAAGILAYFSQTAEPSLLVAAAPAGLGLAALAAAWRFPVARAAALCVVLVAAGFADAWWATSRSPPWSDLPHGGTLVAGTVGLVEALPKGRRVTFRAPRLDGDGPLARSLRIRLRATDLRPIGEGDEVSVRALVSLPAPPDVPGGRDPQRDAFFSGVAGYGFAIGPSTMLRQAPPRWWRGLRERVAGRIQSALPGDEGAIASTLLTGLGSAIPPADRAAFQDSGLAHLLAVAGLHVGIVMGLVFVLVRTACSACESIALRWPARRSAAMAALAAGLAYLVLTGGHLPILRSFAMASVLTLGILTGRRAVSLRSLGFAAMLLLLWSPIEVTGVGFQMSFAAVLGLVAGAEVLAPLARRLRTGRWWSRPARQIAALAMTSAIAGTASLPFAMYHFGRAILYYVPANMLAVPLTAFWVMPCGILALILMPFGLERLALDPMGWGIDGLLWIAHAVAAWPGAARDVGQMPGAALAWMAAGMAWLGLWRSRVRLLGAAPLATGVLMAAVAGAPDVVVGPEADVIAARVGGLVLVERARRATALEREAPARYWGLTRTEDFPPEGRAAGDAVACDASACRWMVDRWEVTLVRNSTELPCRGALLVSAQTLKNACAGLAVVDRAAVRRAGAAAVRFTAAGVSTTTDKEFRGDRPWVIDSTPLLPSAPTE